METILRKLGRTTARRPLLTIGAWVLAVVALFGLGQAAGGGFVNEFRIPGSEAQKAVDLATEHFPEMGAVSADVTWRAESGSLSDPGKAAAIKDVVAAFGTQPDVNSADNPMAAQGTRSEDGKTALSSVQYGKPIGDLTADAFKRLDKAADKARQAGVDVEFRGQVADLASAPETGSSELVGVAVALLILLLAFGSVVAAGLPVLVALAGLAGGTALVLIAGTGMDIPATAPIVAVMLGLGAGVDYALFVVTRFRQSLARGQDKIEAVGEAMATAGHAVLFAGATVVAAILGLLLTGIPFIGGMGVAAALTVAMTLTSALTLLPAVLGLLGHRVNALRVGRRRRPVTDPENSFWGRWVGAVVRRRYLFAGASLVVLAVISIPLFSLRMGTPDDGNNPQSFTQRRAYDTVTEAFGPGSNAQLMLVAKLPGGSGDDAVLKRLGTALGKDKEVANATPAALSKDKEVALVTVVPKHGPQAQQVSDLLHRIRDDIAPGAVAGTGVKVYVGGTTAFVTDLSDAVGKRLPWMVLAVLGVAVVLLIGMFRAPLMALKAALMALLSVGSSIGVLVAVFQWGWGLSLIGLDATVPIISMVPMLLFAVLFGLSMDYEVFILSAIKEEYDRTRDPVRALRAGLGSTALVVVAAAAIMALVFLSFVPISDPSIKMIGVGLAAAVLVDVGIVRMILLPAVMGILGHTAWLGSGVRGRSATATSTVEVPAPVSATTAADLADLDEALPEVGADVR
ncbi:MMPL family transporter [Streptomyces sp. NPDC050095]|uniref:MMPL family transporter n=1 Tax=unclassified Streptomyces TaxID=2593676 RepID=UPI00342CB322